MQLKNLLALPVIGLLAASASAQAFNIDLNVAPGTEPIPSYGAFTGISGFWNPTTQGVTGQPLQLLNGAIDNSTITITPATMGTNSALIPLVDADLMVDYMANDTFQETVTIDNLDVGDYTLVLYSWAPTSSTFFTVEANGFTQDSGVVTAMGGTYPGFVQGESLLTLQFTNSTPNGTMVLDMFTESFSVLNGMQLFPSYGTAGCTQPVPNSQGGTPDIIGTGSIVAADNSLVVRAGILPSAALPWNPNSPGAVVTFVSNQENNNAPFVCPNDPTVVTGVRCIGPGLARIVTGNPGQVGFISNGVYSVPVDLVQLASQGINTAPGSTLYFQMVYRDTPDAFCTVNLARWTNSVAITLQ